MGTASKSIACSSKRISFHFLNCKTPHSNQSTFSESRIFEFFQCPPLIHPFHCQNRLTIHLARYPFHSSKISFLASRNGWCSLPFNGDRNFWTCPGAALSWHSAFRPPFLPLAMHATLPTALRVQCYWKLPLCRLLPNASLCFWFAHTFSFQLVRHKLKFTLNVQLLLWWEDAWTGVFSRSRTLSTPWRRGRGGKLFWKYPQQKGSNDWGIFRQLCYTQTQGHTGTSSIVETSRCTECALLKGYRGR